MNSAPETSEAPTTVPTTIPAIAPPDRPLALDVTAVARAVDVPVEVVVAPPIFDDVMSGSSVETLKHGISVINWLRGTYVMSEQA